MHPKINTPRPWNSELCLFPNHKYTKCASLYSHRLVCVSTFQSKLSEVKQSKEQKVGGDSPWLTSRRHHRRNDRFPPWRENPLCWLAQTLDVYGLWHVGTGIIVWLSWCSTALTYHTTFSHKGLRAGRETFWSFCCIEFSRFLEVFTLLLPQQNTQNTKSLRLFIPERTIGH